MAYNIGQIRKSTSTSYLTNVSYTVGTITSIGFSSTPFDDFCLNGAFSEANTYYLKFRLKRRTAADYISSFTFSLVLSKTNTGLDEDVDKQILASKIKVDKYVNGENDEYFNYEIIFKPNDSYSYLGFIAERTATDYAGDKQTYISISTIDLSDQGCFKIVRDILPVHPIRRLGVQSSPGFICVVNGEPIKLGRRGQYELNNGMEINSVGVISFPDDGMPFLIDYAWIS